MINIENISIKMLNTVFLLIFLKCIMFVQCSITNYRDPGDTHPHDVEIAVGRSFNISCSMNLAVFPGRTVGDLHFINMTDNETPLPVSDIDIINSTTIVYILRNATEQQSRFLCKCDGDAIYFTNVYVGAPPRPIEEFSCSSYDFEYMLCNFTKPNNPILTQYNLSFYLESSDYQYYPTCNYGKSVVNCNATIQKFRQGLEHYHFILQAINALGTRMQRFNINLFDVMIPATPGEDFRLINLGTNSIEVAWRMKHLDWYRFKTLQWQVLLKTENFPVQDITNQSTYNRARNEWHLQFKSLPYAYYWYQLSLRVRVRTSNKWSEPFYYKFRTAPRLPDRPPRTSAGSFYVDSTETHVRLYWEQLESYEHNGANMTYVISEMVKNDVKIKPVPILLELNSAIFAWNKTSHYVFSIRSRNHIGESHESSQIEIPPFENRDVKDYTPHSVHNVEHVTNRTYTLTWGAPTVSEGLQNYTVFWCLSKRALQNECRGSISFKVLSSETRIFTTMPQSTMEVHTLNLAVSANYIDYNTGMHWTTCTLDVNSELIKMEPDVHVIGATSIKVQWSQIVCPSILKGYNFTYCEIENAENNACVDAPEYIIIDKNDIKTEITNLKPYTLYKFGMFMFSAQKYGKMSDAIIKRTAESAPSPPRFLKLLKVTNSTATISWLSPISSNGIIRNYIVFLNSKQVAVINETTEPEPKILYKLENLTSFTAYKVFVVAETIVISNASNDIHFTTLISYPSKPEISNPILDNNSEVTIKWSRPALPGGRLEFYEVEVRHTRNDEIVGQRISTIIGATTCVLKIPACLDHDYRTTVDVRAVNAALLQHEVDLNDMEYYLEKIYNDLSTKFYKTDDELVCMPERKQNMQMLQEYHNEDKYRLYKSPWQRGPMFGCSPNRLSKITTIALLVVLLTITIMAGLFVARKKYNKMANIDCKLPPGLAAYITKDGLSTDFMISEKNDDTSSLQRSIYQNEKHHLLGSADATSTDVNTLTDSTVLSNIVDPFTVDSCVKTTSSNQLSRETDNFVQSTDECCSEGVEIDKMDTEQHSALSLENSENQICLPIMPLQTQTSSNITASNYVRPNALGCVQTISQPYFLPSPPATATVQSSGYITVNSIAALATNTTVTPITTTATNMNLSSSSGYVQPSDIQMLSSSTNMNGCTSLESLCQINPSATTSYGESENNNNNINDNTTMNVPNTREAATQVNKSISGYVTQKDLTSFGKQKHIN